MIDTPSPTPKTEVAEPISAPSAELQYRAVGLLWGKYIPGEEFNSGVLLSSDGIQIEAVILGKLLGLVKSQLVDLEQEHLWVVYPRTKAEGGLHIQMSGIWSPETLHKDAPVPEHKQSPDYFSVRGEVVFQEQEKGTVVVKIVQKPRKSGEKPKFFKLTLQGVLPEKANKNFWDLQVKRVGDALVILDGERLAYLGKPKSQKPTKGKPQKKPYSSGAPSPTRQTPKPVPKPKPKTTQ